MSRVRCILYTFYIYVKNVLHKVHGTTCIKLWYGSVYVQTPYTVTTFPSMYCTRMYRNQQTTRSKLYDVLYSPGCIIPNTIYAC
jgi:hypothetical protein